MDRGKDRGDELFRRMAVLFSVFFLISSFFVYFFFGILDSNVNPGPGSGFSFGGHKSADSGAGNKITGNAVFSSQVRVIDTVPEFINLRNLTYYANETVNLTRDITVVDYENKTINRYYVNPFDLHGIYVPHNITGIMKFWTIVTAGNGEANISANITITIINSTPICPVTVILQRPYDGELVYTSQNGNTILYFDVVNQSRISSCTLYLEQKFATTLVPWMNYSVQRNISGNSGFFNVNSLLRGTYIWNVRCSDMTGRWNFSRYNSSFTVNYLSTQDLTNENSFSDSLTSFTRNYDFELVLPRLSIVEGSVENFTGKIVNYGDPITSVSIFTDKPYVLPGVLYFQNIEQSADVDIYVDAKNLNPGKYNLTFMVTSDMLRYKKQVTLEVLSKNPHVETPGEILSLYVRKRLYLLDLFDAAKNTNESYGKVLILVSNMNPIDVFNITVHDDKTKIDSDIYYGLINSSIPSADIFRMMEKYIRTRGSSAIDGNDPGGFNDSVLKGIFSFSKIKQDGLHVQNSSENTRKKILDVTFPVIPSGYTAYIMYSTGKMLNNSYVLTENAFSLNLSGSSPKKIDVMKELETKNFDFKMNPSDEHNFGLIALPFLILILVLLMLIKHDLDRKKRIGSKNIQKEKI